MDLRPTPEQDALRKVGRDFIGTINPLEQLNRNVDDATGFTSRVWRKLAELGWLGLTVPEDLGGAGATHSDTAVLFEEVGAGLLPVPLLATVAHVLPWLTASPDSEELIPAVVGGERRVAFAGASVGGRTLFDAFVPLTVGGTSTQPLLSGTRTWVIGADAADAFLVPVWGDAPAILLVDAAHASVRPTESLDASQSVSEVVFDSAPARILLSGQEATDTARRVEDLSGLFASAEAVGIISRLLTITAEYTSLREQFDRPVATFQGVSHQLADLYVDGELARSLVLWAAFETDRLNAPASLEIAAAAAHALPAAVAAAETAIQLHGGIGMTWDSPLHRYYKRALFLRASHQGSSALLRQIARDVLTPAG
ncbi:acyl-CoA dehydrogenase [Rhodococcus sp. WS4]|nr:acyl-CoA dehydrogenase [Rhodococcus sp. WS4]